MTCREVDDFLMAYLDGELPSEQHVMFAKHLDRCPHCVHYLQTYQITVQLTHVIGNEPEEPVPDELVQAVLAARRR